MNIFSSTHTCGVNMNFQLQQTNELLASNGGLALVGALLAKTSLTEQLNQLSTPANRGQNLKNSDIALAMLGLLVQGKCDFDDIENHRNDPFFQRALGLSRIPAAPSLRQRLDLAKATWDTVVLNASMALIANHTIQTPCFENYIPLDADVTPMDNSGSNKEGVSRTYKGFDGFAPMLMYIGNEGYLLNLEFREGKTHCQNGTSAFLRHCFSLLPRLKHKNYLLRLDSGNDALDNQIECQKFNKEHASIQIDYIIKRNLRTESPLKWLETAQESGQCIQQRPGKKVYYGKHLRKYDKLEEPQTIVYKVIERTITRTGQQLLIPEVEVETYFSTLETTPEQTIELYHDHGTSEQFHSEFKTDMGLERLPSGNFNTNTRVMFLALLAFNLLRIIGQESLNYKGHPVPSLHRIRRRRLRSVIQDLIYLAVRLIRHARQLVLGFGKICPFFDTYLHLYLKWTG